MDAVNAGGEQAAMDVEVRAGEAFNVDLPQLGVAGYQWLVAELPAGVTLVDDSTAGPGAGAAPGTPAQRRFRFMVEAPGRYRVVLAAKRAWEAQPARRQVVEVTAR
ncbi:protease inhibitor I42 family protein [Croceibacterium sp. TMG7-5b_MA50]|uniref:protease inhibitor I42 family protein n=1 Tax=Croceibacterium sp. TMG7-5b_MA50 TaxID=3121290 RepID=UPI003221AA8C